MGEIGAWELWVGQQGPRGGEGDSRTSARGALSSLPYRKWRYVRYRVFVIARHTREGVGGIAGLSLCMWEIFGAPLLASRRMRRRCAPCGPPRRRWGGGLSAPRPT
jgi:hypothetical protein